MRSTPGVDRAGQRLALPDGVVDHPLERELAREIDACLRRSEDAGRSVERLVVRRRGPPRGLVAGRAERVAGRSDRLPECYAPPRPRPAGAASPSRSERLRLRGEIGLFTGSSAEDTGAALVLEVTER